MRAQTKRKQPRFGITNEEVQRFRRVLKSETLSEYLTKTEARFQHFGFGECEDKAVHEDLAEQLGMMKFIVLLLEEQYWAYFRASQAKDRALMMEAVDKQHECMEALRRLERLVDFTVIARREGLQ